MSNKIKGFLVTLASDLSEEDAQRVIDAIRMVKGVMSVNSIDTDPMEDRIVTTRVVLNIREKILAVLRDELDEKLDFH